MPTSVARFVVPAHARHQRLDHFLTAQLPQLSRARLQQLIREGHATLNGKPILRPGLRLRGGERLELRVVARPPLAAAEPEDIPLNILYEDDDLIAVDKPAGLVVHAGAGRTHGTLVNALLHRYRKLSSVGSPLRPGIVHRLDKNTSGIILVAKNDQAHRHLAAQFSHRTVEKRYLALLHGRLSRSPDTISLPIARDLRRRTRMTTRRPQGRQATTSYRVLQSTGGFTLVEAQLHTGRTHQVRVHFSALGHPVVGDTLYGAPRRLPPDNAPALALNRNFLHARSLRLQHPRTGEPLALTSLLPAELTDLLRALGFKLPVTD
jgi:23S rRNA pseudouridine1911/1915/1917 synthase